MGRYEDDLYGEGGGGTGFLVILGWLAALFLVHKISNVLNLNKKGRTWFWGLLHALLMLIFVDAPYATFAGSLGIGIILIFSFFIGGVTFPETEKKHNYENQYDSNTINKKPINTVPDTQNPSTKGKVITKNYLKPPQGAVEVDVLKSNEKHQLNLSIVYIAADAYILANDLQAYEACLVAAKGMSKNQIYEFSEHLIGLKSNAGTDLAIIRRKNLVDAINYASHLSKFNAAELNSNKWHEAISTNDVEWVNKLFRSAIAGSV